MTMILMMMVVVLYCHCICGQIKDKARSVIDLEKEFNRNRCGDIDGYRRLC